MYSEASIGPLLKRDVHTLGGPGNSQSDWFPARSPSPSPGVGQVPGHRPALRADGLHGASAQVDGRLTTYSGLAPTPQTTTTTRGMQEQEQEEEQEEEQEQG